jgi:hypothetical protein
MPFSTPKFSIAALTTLTKPNSTPCSAPVTAFFPATTSLGRPCVLPQNVPAGSPPNAGIPKQQGQTLDDGSYQLQIPYSDDRELIMDILKYGGDCQVMAPEQLKQRVADEFRRGMQRYQA